MRPRLAILNGLWTSKTPTVFAGFQGLHMCVCVCAFCICVFVCVSNPSFRECVPVQSVCMQPEITSHDRGQVYRILWISVQYIF